jgi:hypothetical protein
VWRADKKTNLTVWRISLPSIRLVKPPSNRTPPKNISPMQVASVAREEFLPALPKEFILNRIFFLSLMIE